MENMIRKCEEQEKRERRFWLILTGAVTFVSAGFAIYSHHELKKAVHLINKAVDGVAELSVVDVQQGIIDRAINVAADREVSKAVSHSVRQISGELSSEAQKRVRNAVQQCYPKLQKTVTDAIAAEAAKVDQSVIMEEATERAKTMLLERFDGKLDGLMSDYQRNLDNVGKIYQSIASSMADKAGKDVTLKLG